MLTYTKVYKMKTSIFELGQTVSHPKDLYGNTVSKVTKIEKYFRYNEPGSLTTLESTVKHILPKFEAKVKEIDGNFFLVKKKVDFNYNVTDKFEFIPFAGFMYTVTNDDISTVVMEHHLRTI